MIVWDCFINDKLGLLVIIRENINAKKYLEILQEHLLPFYESLGNDNVYFFQDDNASVYRARIITDWKDENLISFFSWSVQSSDLNLIKHVWDYLKRRVRQYSSRPKFTEELVSVLQEEWLNIDLEYLKKLVISMPKRV